MRAERRDLLLWLLVLGAPAVWLCSFEAKFAWAPWTCTFQRKLALFLIAGLALLLEIASAAGSFGIWKQLGKEWAGADGGPVPRSRIMAICGVFFGLGFGLIVIAQAIPEIVLGACQ